MYKILFAVIFYYPTASVSLCVCVFVCVRRLKSKRLELSTPNSVKSRHVATGGHWRPPPSFCRRRPPDENSAVCLYAIL